MRNHRKKLIFVFTLISLSYFGIIEARAETEKTNNEDFKFSGQIQVRTEVDGRDFSNITVPKIFTSLRTSLSVQKTFFDKLKIFIQMRDSRVFGEEATTITNFKNMDLHQAYVLITKPFDIPLSLQVGRFEQNYGTQRFIGSVDWNYVGRSFDGLKLMYSREEINFKTDFFAYTLVNSIGYTGNPAPGSYLNIPVQGMDLYGFWSSVKFFPQLDFDLFGLFENNRKPVDSNSIELNRGTVGLNHKGTYGPFSSIVEAAYQFGKNKTLDINAYLLSGQIFYSLSDFKFGLGADILSGNDPKSLKTNNSFASPYASNHPFYGYMDYFIDIPGNTKNLGLNDFYLTSNWKKEEFPLSANLNLHYFTSNQAGPTGENTFGQEADLVLKYKLMENVNFSLGNSLFFPGNLMKTAAFFGPKNGDLSYWGYLMLNAGF